MWRPLFSKVMKKVKTGREVISMIAESLKETDEQFIIELADQLLLQDITYLGKDLFEVEG